MTLQHTQIYIYIYMQLHCVKNSLKNCLGNLITIAFRQQLHLSFPEEVNVLISIASVLSGQRSPNPPEFVQPWLSRSNGGHPQRRGTNLDVFVPAWLVLPRREATNCVCLIRIISTYSKGAVQIQVGLELAEKGQARLLLRG